METNFKPANKEEVEEFIQYLTYRYRKICVSMDMIDIHMIDKNLSEPEKEIKNKKIKGPMRNAVGDYTKIIDLIKEGKIIVSADTIKKFKQEVESNVKNTGS